MTNIKLSECLAILKKIQVTTQELTEELDSPKNGNVILTKEQAEIIKRKFRDTRIDEILK